MLQSPPPPAQQPPPPAQPLPRRLRSPDDIVASFFAIGDWGYYDKWRPDWDVWRERRPWAVDWRDEARVVTPDCQFLLAGEMRRLVVERAATEPFRFVVNVGDNFYRRV
jgi:hypothetical protein